MAPASQVNFITLNKELADSWPNINQVRGALPEAERWAGVEGKLAHLTLGDPVAEPEAR